jgi:hypothetical protein
MLQGGESMFWGRVDVVFASPLPPGLRTTEVQDASSIRVTLSSDEGEPSHDIEVIAATSKVQIAR